MLRTTQGLFYLLLFLTIAMIIFYTIPHLHDYFPNIWSNSVDAESVLGFNILRNKSEIAWPDNKRIFFIETSGRIDINLRQTCAIESAAKLNPTRKIQLFLINDTTLNSSGNAFRILSQYPNVAVYTLNTDQFFRNTLLEDWYKEGIWKTSPYKWVHFSDYMRALFLFKGGGLYMDLDFIVLKTFDPTILWNFVPIENYYSLTLSTGHFEQGHPILKTLLEALSTQYDPQQWAKHGPQMVTSIVQKYCNISESTFEPIQCHDLKTVRWNYFYPINWTKWGNLFVNGSSNILAEFSDSYAIHYWNKLTSKSPIVIGSTQILALAAQLHCPLSVRAAGSRL